MLVVHQLVSWFSFYEPWGGGWCSGVSTFHFDCFGKMQPHLPPWWWRANCVTGWLTYNCLPHGICPCFSKRSPPTMLPLNLFGLQLCRTHCRFPLPRRTPAVWHSTNFSPSSFQNFQVLSESLLREHLGVDYRRREWWVSYLFLV